MRNCPNCGKEITGRSDKIYCSRYCKSNWYYERSKSDGTRYEEVKGILKSNRRILKQFNKMGKTTIRYSSLVEAGFNKNYFTNFWKSGGGRVYLFCFEQGFYAIPGSNPLKYSLIQWQDYMRDDLSREE